ncbi:hypothetical protein LRS37_12925 [Neobacillus sedimentimangrovi]|uniref:Uncharacterized protein n=1 Tax=Neobacillus sedimentimangrovi TaxID=2699460 RepID=A0ABS8QKE0_9BACI|nr:hypothetical protein [Neobacillus sedimentimangrovi]MCD4839753.1 hypothetical protein [Neobacillus sedimentimangrovi]
MRKRDLEIIKHLEMFRVMSRDDIVDLHFKHLKNPIGNANTVLKRLVRDGQIEVSTMHSPYLYFPVGNHIKKNSTKIPHYLKLVQVYKDLCEIEPPTEFIIEPQYKKGLAEPDIYCVFKGTPLFIEVQNSIYSSKQMEDKIKRYELLKQSELVKPFPTIIMITNTRYAIESDQIKVIQTPSIAHLIHKANEDSNTPPPPQPIKTNGNITFKL